MKRIQKVRMQPQLNFNTLSPENGTQLLALDHPERATGAFQTDGVYSVPLLLTAPSVMASRNFTVIRNVIVLSAS